jgi:hypothetical protein
LHRFSLSILPRLIKVRIKVPPHTLSAKKVVPPPLPFRENLLLSKKNQPKSAKNHENCEKSPKVGKNGFKQLKNDLKGSFERFFSLLNPKTAQNCAKLR